MFDRLAPLYIFIALGFLAARRVHLSRDSISSFLIYYLAPLMIFTSLLAAPLSLGTWFLPFAYLAISSIIAIVIYNIPRLFKGPTHNLFAFGSGNANTGYFGIPITAALVGEEAVPLAVLIALGLIIYENTVGFYITGRAHFSVAEVFKKLSRLPTIYAAILAVLWRVSGLNTYPWLEQMGQMARSTYSVLGFVMIGIGLASIQRKQLPIKYIMFSQGSKFLIWPAMTVLLIWVLGNFQFGLSAQVVKVMAVMAFVPMAANTVVFASLLKAEPEKAAAAVFFSTLISIVLLLLSAPNWLLRLFA